MKSHVHSVIYVGFIVVKRFKSLLRIFVEVSDCSTRVDEIWEICYVDVNRQVIKSDEDLVFEKVRKLRKVLIEKYVHEAWR